MALDLRKASSGMNTMAKFSAQPKARIHVRNNPEHGFPSGIPIEVNVNGVYYCIPEGEATDVPASVWYVLRDTAVKMLKEGHRLEGEPETYVMKERYFVDLIVDPDAPKPGRPYGYSPKAAEEAREQDTQEEVKAGEVNDSDTDIQ